MTARTFDEILKFNPYHDKLGRFASADGAASFTYKPGASTAHSRAIDKEKERNEQTGKGFKGTLYHGSPATDIKEFDMSRAGQNTSSGEKLLYFTDSKQMAEDFSYERLEGSSKYLQRRGKKGRVYEVDVEMKNPLDFRKLTDKDVDNLLKLDTEGLLTKDIVQSLSNNHQLLKASLDLRAESLIKLGYDGMIANTGKAGHNSLEYAVVDPKQAKIKKSVEDVDTIADKEFSIFKTDDDKRLVFGWASISITVDGEQLEDRQQDMIDPEELERAAYEYVLHFRDTGEEHISSMRKKGKLVESCVFTVEKQRAMGIPEGTLPVGWWIGFHISDDDAWERVKNGTYKMFSIEGKAHREPVEVVEKANPYHDEKGRFAPAPGGTNARIAEIDSRIAELEQKLNAKKILDVPVYENKSGRFYIHRQNGRYKLTKDKDRAEPIKEGREQEVEDMVASQYKKDPLSRAGTEQVERAVQMSYSEKSRIQDEIGELYSERNALKAGFKSKEEAHAAYEKQIQEKYQANLEKVQGSYFDQKARKGEPFYTQEADGYVKCSYQSAARTITAEAKRMGAEERYASSESGSKFASSVYLRMNDAEIRISDHNLPLTDKRLSADYRTRWDHELILDNDRLIELAGQIRSREALQGFISNLFVGDDFSKSIDYIIEV